jgi:para-nitrobenzyl esterase
MTLMAMEEAKGLFHKAILMSGAPQRFLTPDHGAAVTAQLYRELGIRKGDVEALQAVPMNQLARLMGALDGARLDADGMSSTLKYGPVIDGHVLTNQCWVNGAPELAQDVPTMIGTTLHETAGYIGSIAGELDREPGDDRDFARRLAGYAVVTKARADELVPLIGTYRQAMPSLSPKELMVRISTDIGFWSCSLQIASSKTEQGGSPVFAYECAWATPCFDDKWSLHGVELPFVFNRPRYGVAWDGADSDAARASADPDGHRFRVGGQMFDAWMAFAHTADPSTDGLTWPAYDTTSRPTMVFDSSTRVVNDNRGAVRPHVAALTSR